MSRTSRALNKQNREQMAAQFVQSGLIKGIIDETRKVVWPSMDELMRLTGVVVVTVILFTVVIGGVDEILTNLVKPIYTSVKTTQTSATPTPNVGVTQTPVPTVVPTTTAAPAATPTAKP